MFLYSSAVILLLTAAAKFASSFGHDKILLEYDPVLGFQFRTLFWLVASVESGVAVTCFRSGRTWLSTGLVAWLATSFVAYRLAMWKIGYHKPCGCLGNLTGALHISPEAADTIMKVILAYLLVGSYAGLFWLRGQHRKVH